MGGNWREMFPTPLMCIITKSVRSKEENTHVDEYYIVPGLVSAMEKNTNI